MTLQRRHESFEYITVDPAPSDINHSIFSPFHGSGGVLACSCLTPFGFRGVGAFLDHRKLTSLQVQHFQAWLHRRACEGCLISPSFNYLLRSPGDGAKGPALMSGGSIEGNGNKESVLPHLRHAICLPVFAPSQQMVRRSDGVCLWTPSKMKAAWRQTTVQSRLTATKLWLWSKDADLWLRGENLLCKE